ncbi:PAS domain-containing sensor histidine kinase [Stutzerimonas kirkiae]|uniref:Histidine kinase n=1 Tax=Stutzerimonas kirkiae TaxID=2211392 RepID=A0A4Q9R147_9GAMM|nr:sensor histidine kinase [Stutzerimonas kirkiae]TBU92203.1 histidine kinase [Stutzerimonas kirkiae]TBV01183.1 histidine kinase [Stutzerimonas kirkiae]TBV10486.1 histidine kinase [Stutzerimonas kirkiae]TBV13958.1 histidine kinase [Stutzerimonas kirkiae]
MSRCLLLPLFALWLSLSGLAGAADGAAFSAQQQAWLAEHRQLQVGVILQAPYAQLERRQQRLSGANAQLMERLAQLMGVELRWHYFSTQDDLQRALREKRVDLAPGLSQTPAGLRLWNFSDPYMRVAHLLLGRREGTGSVDMDDLAHGTLVAAHGSATVLDYLLTSYPHLRLEESPTASQALHAVLGQQARYAVVGEAQVSRLSRDPEFAELAIVGDIGFPLLLRVGTRKDWPELAEIVDVALHAIPARELDLLHQRWLQIAYPMPSAAQDLLRNLCLLFGVLLLVSGMLLVSLRRQRDELQNGLLAARQEIEAREVSRDALRLSQFSLDNSTLGILWVNWDSHIGYANRAVEQMLGYAQGALVDRPLIDLEPRLHMDRWLELWRNVRQEDEREMQFETECLRADGSLLPVDVSLSFMRYRKTEYLVVFVTDVTERRRALAALQESQARLQGIAANVPGMVFRLERETPAELPKFAFISEGSESLAGYSPATLLSGQRGIFSLVHEADQADYLISRDRALAHDRDWQWQGRILTRGGELRWADIKATARKLDSGTVVWDGIVWDISENKRNELALVESRLQLRELAAHLESVREEEKAHIAREVHDELGQVLTVLKLETSMCELSYAYLDPGLQGRLGNMKKLIAQLFQLVRDVATALRPPILDAGIASAIEWQARRFEARTQIPCLVDVPENLPPLPDAKAIGLFRVLQEALTNVMRHARAHTVELRLALEDGMLCLSISDDGQGFDPAAVGTSSFGLVGMRERVMILGGSLEIESRAGVGTLLCVKLALDE